MAELLAQARLDRFTAMLNQVLTILMPEITAIGARFQAARKPALTRLQALMDEAERSIH